MNILELGGAGWSLTATDAVAKTTVLLGRIGRTHPPPRRALGHYSTATSTPTAGPAASSGTEAATTVPVATTSAIGAGSVLLALWLAGTLLLLGRLLLGLAIVQRLVRRTRPG